MNAPHGDSDRTALPFCPGCGHGSIVDAIGRALEKSARDPKRCALVSDIGCVGMADRLFDVHTFHGLHGRSFTYACGIAQANPDLLVFTLVGDGGCGIGLSHLLNAARRNDAIKVIVFNNFNFGMTGGEHSVTTPEGSITTTTPRGHVERPLNICALALAAGAGFVARKTAYERDVDEVIARGFRHEGFALIEVLEICTAYYMPMNKFKKGELEQMIRDRNLQTGILKEETRPSLGQLLRGLIPDEKRIWGPEGIERAFEAHLPRGDYSVVLAGSAGMKIVSAATNLARAAISSGLTVSQQDDYPVTVQTGHSLSELKFSGARIHDPGIEKADALLIVSEEGHEHARRFFPKMTEEGIIIATAGLPDITSRARIIRFDPLDRAHGLTKANAMTAAMTFLLRESNLFPLEALRRVFTAIADEKIRASNLTAMDAVPMPV